MLADYPACDSIDHSPPESQELKEDTLVNGVKAVAGASEKYKVSWGEKKGFCHEEENGDILK